MQFTSFSLRYEPVAPPICLSGTDVWSQKPSVLMAVKTASDLGIFDSLSENPSPVCWKELAGPRNADIQLVGKFQH